jgi:hypothetical protein
VGGSQSEASGEWREENTRLYLKNDPEHQRAMGKASNYSPPSLSLHVARITGMSHRHPGF